jgi:hypothetical protein
MQGHLFDTPIHAGIESSLRTPVARDDDPEPSKEAAREITGSGKREGQLMGVLALVKRYPLSTTLELAQHGYNVHVIGRRLPELVKGGLVNKRKVRKCTIGNRSATTWEAVQ